MVSLKLDDIVVVDDDSARLASSYSAMQHTFHQNMLIDQNPGLIA